MFRILHAPVTLFVLVFLLFLTSCGDATRTNLPVATGKLGSLVVTADNSVHKALKGIIDSAFLSPVPHLPGGEPFFELLKPDFYDFDRFYYNQKSVLVLVDEASVDGLEELLQPFTMKTIRKNIASSEPVLMSKRNLFAKHQHIVYLFGKDANDLRNKLRKCRTDLVASLMDYELLDQKEKLFRDTSSNDRFFSMIQDELGLGVQIPSMFRLKHHANKTYWFQYDAIENEVPKTIALVVHAYPYRDTGDFSYASIRSVRDTVFRYLIKGEIPGTYMGTTESEFYPPIFRKVQELNGKYCVKIRGWWTIRGMSMAGPFIRYVVHIPETNMLFAFEGFVYKPNMNTKERDLRLIESIALTIR